MHRFRVDTALILPFIVISALAQRPTGRIDLEVKDATGAGVHASGRLAGAAPGTDRGFETDAAGKHSFANLPYGRYQIEISKRGFVSQSVTVTVESAAPAPAVVTLALGKAAFSVDVVATTPLSGTNLTIDQIAAPVQTGTTKNIEDSGATDLSEFLNRRLEGVHVNENQENPFQPDVNYRGYSASPLLGTPEGLSVYMDGVRQNQPFGDVVAWDLIPRIAISEITLIPGSDPLFGLNTLGGALSVQTKDGYSQPGTSIQATGGQFGRRSAELEHGRSNSHGLNWYLAGNLYREDGWRASSTSEVRQSFAKVGWQRGSTLLALSGGYSDNWLNGNGLQEQRFLARDYSSVYTLPDTTKNREPFVNLNARHTLGSALSVSGNLYFRYIRADTFNADLNENSLDQPIYQPNAADVRALTAAGYSGFPLSGANASNTPFPSWRCIAQALQKDEPAEKCDGLLTHTYNKQNNYGLSAQVSWLASPHSHRNQLTGGMAFDGSGVRFQQASQFGFINGDRSVTGVNAFADGSTMVDGSPYDTRVDLHGRIRTWSVYAADTLTAGKWNLTVSGRFNHSSIDNADRIDPVEGPGSLTSLSRFNRLNPSAGATYTLSARLNFYASYSEGSRTPTSIELGCADPSIPCKLPNALAGDPPLKQVVTHTWEAGVRGSSEGGVHWNLGWFRAGNHDDLLFVSSPQSGFGYFRNFGETRRQGLEANLNGRVRRLTLGGGYTYLAATYESPETIDGSSNSSNDAASAGTAGLDGTIQIHPGDRIPLVPHHLLKANADYQATAKLGADVDFIATSSSYARGNENNRSQPDGVYYLGPGTSPGYGVLNLGLHYQLARRVRLFAQFNNLLDHRYYSGAQLGPTGFSAAGTIAARPFAPIDGEYPLQHATFYAPGAPRTVWGGMRFTF